MDNRKISIQSEGRAAFDLAIQLMFDGRCHKATHYFEHPTKGFILLWHEDSFNLQEEGALPAILCQKANKLPYAMDEKAAADLAWGWLSERKVSEYQEWCDHDGSDGHGFRVYNEDWNKVAGSHYGILGVIPVWAWYGK
jgi:hypothetical protein